jgi:hypothetical protein
MDNPAPHILTPPLPPPGPEAAFDAGVPGDADLLQLHILRRRSGHEGLLYLAPGAKGPLTSLQDVPEDLLLLAWDGRYIGTTPSPPSPRTICLFVAAVEKLSVSHPPLASAPPLPQAPWAWTCRACRSR